MRIVIADDHPLFRDGLRQLLEKQFSGADIVDAEDFESANRALGVDTDLLVLDLTFPGFNPGFDLPALRRAHPTTPIVVISMEGDALRIKSVMSCGVNGFISKSTPPDEIDSALKKIMQGDVLICAVDATSERADDALSREQKLAQLSNRQIQVLRGICQGQSNKEIARDLHLSPNTVRLHVSAVLRGLSVGTRTAAATLAISTGLFASKNM